MTEKQIRLKLRRLGKRREQLKTAQEQLHRETRDGLRLAREKLSVKEASSLVGLTRSTVYEVYYQGGTGERNGAKNAGSKASERDQVQAGG